MKKSNNILLIIFLATVIPTIYVYGEHTKVELEAYDKAKTETKKIKTFGEALLFGSIALGYIILTVLIVFAPKYRIPYIIVLVGTVAVVVLYYLRIYGIPIPGTEIVIVDFSSDWRDVITKVCQQILVIPAAMLLLLRPKQG